MALLSSGCVFLEPGKSLALYRYPTYSHLAKNSNKQHSSKQMASSSSFWKAESWNLDTLPPTVTESSTCQLKGSSWPRPSTLRGSLQPAWPTSIPTHHHSSSRAKHLVQSQMLLKMYTQIGAALCLLPRHQVPFLAKDDHLCPSVPPAGKTVPLQQLQILGLPPVTQKSWGGEGGRSWGPLVSASLCLLLGDNQKQLFPS